MKKLLVVFLCLGSLGLIQAQDCAEGFNHKANADGIPIQVYSPDYDECFQVIIKGETLNPEPAKSVYFYAPKQAQTKIVVKLSNGERLEKNFFDNGNLGSAAFYIDKNKKGKYSLKFSMKNSSQSQAARDEFAAKQQEAEAERKAKKEADDKRWAEESAARQARMKEAVKPTEVIEREQREAEEARKAEEAKKAAEEEARQAKIAQNQASGSSSSGGSSSANRSGTPIRFRLLRAGSPITHTNVTLKSGNTVVAKGKTDGEGKIEMFTQLPNGRIPIDIYGQKGDESWSVTQLYSVNIGSTEAYEDFDLTQGIKQMMELMNKDGDEIMQSFGF